MLTIVAPIASLSYFTRSESLGSGPYRDVRGIALVRCCWCYLYVQQLLPTVKVIVFTIQVAEIKMKMQVEGINLSILNISTSMTLSITLRDV